jgi:hypothetical protein
VATETLPQAKQSAADHSAYQLSPNTRFWNSCHRMKYDSTPNHVAEEMAIRVVRID